MTPQNIKENGLGIDNHPTVKQHILSARQLTEFISQLKGWDVDPQIMMAKLSGESQITLYANCVECLKSGVTGDIVVIADGQPISPLSVTTDEAKATLIITVNRNIAEADKIELRGTAEFQKIMRCEVEKH